MNFDRNRRCLAVVFAAMLVAVGSVAAQEPKETEPKPEDTHWVKKPGSERPEVQYRVLMGVQPEVDWIRSKPERSQSWRLGFPVGILPVPELELAVVPSLYRADRSIDDFVAFELRGRAVYVVQAFEGTYLIGAQMGEVFRNGDNWESGEAVAGMRVGASQMAVFDFGATLGWLFIEGQSPMVLGLSAALRLGF